MPWISKANGERIVKNANLKRVQALGPCGPQRLWCASSGHLGQRVVAPWYPLHARLGLIFFLVELWLWFQNELKSNPFMISNVLLCKRNVEWTGTVCALWHWTAACRWQSCSSRPYVVINLDGKIKILGVSFVQYFCGIYWNLLFCSELDLSGLNYCC